MQLQWPARRTERRGWISVGQSSDETFPVPCCPDCFLSSVDASVMMADLSLTLCTRPPSISDGSFGIFSVQIRPKTNIKINSIRIEKQTNQLLTDYSRQSDNANEIVHCLIWRQSRDTDFSKLPICYLIPRLALNGH